MGVYIQLLSDMSTWYAAETDLAKTNKTAFGEVSVAQNTSLVRLSWPYSINPLVNLTSVTGSAAITQGDGMVRLTTGASINSTATLRSYRVTSYSPGCGVICRFSMAMDPIGTSVANQYALAGIGEVDGGIGLPIDGYFVGWQYSSAGNTNDFCIRLFSNASGTTIRQDDFNGDTLRGTGITGINMATSVSLNRLHVYEIAYQWLGSGAIQFRIEDPNTGLFQTFHEVRYAGTNSLPSSRNPSFRFVSTISNAFSAAIPYQLTHASAAILIQNYSPFTAGLQFAFNFNKSLLANVNTNILTLRNNVTVFSGAANNNRTPIKIMGLSIASDGTRSYVFSCYINASLGGVPSYANIGATTSICAVDTAGTTVSGGRLVSAYTIQKIGNEYIDLSGLYLLLYPGDTFTVSASTSVAGDAFACVNWIEDTA